jgi:hypothetical protein
MLSHWTDVSEHIKVESYLAIRTAGDLLHFLDLPVDDRGQNQGKATRRRGLSPKVSPLGPFKLSLEHAPGQRVEFL